MTTENSLFYSSIAPDYFINGAKTMGSGTNTFSLRHKIINSGIPTICLGGKTKNFSPKTINSGTKTFNFSPKTTCLGDLFIYKNLKINNLIASLTPSPLERAGVRHKN